MRSSKPHWWRPWSDEVSWQAQARKTAAALDAETFLTWLDDAGAEAANLSFGTVWNRSEFIAEWLLGDVGLAAGDRAMLVYAPGPEFFVAFVACLRASVLAVPAYPPDPTNLRRGLGKLDLVCASCEAEVGLTGSIVHKLRVATSVWHSWPRIRWHNTDGLGRGLRAFNPASRSRAETGVMITHQNVWHNINALYLPGQRRMVEDRLGETTVSKFFTTRARRGVDDASFCLINGETFVIIAGLMLMFLGPFLAGYHMINFSPLSFLADPLVWLRAISKYRGIWTASPDFGYQLCTKRAAANAPPKDIDLRSLCALGCGAGQRVVPSILREFAAYWRRARLPDYGNYGIFYPSFGMAEHVVATCGETGGLIPSRQRPDLVSCGSDFVVDLLVVDAETRRVLPDGTPGEMWLCSDSVALGYWGKPKLSNETFRARVEPDDGRVYLRTGDEAFIEDGRLFICGRIKDMIIIGGENYYSDDVEIAATEAVGDAARPGCIAAFAVVDDDDENECLCIVLEVRDSAVSECETLASTLRKSVRKAVGLTPRRVVFIKQKTILKTTSGKLRRRAIRGALLAGDLSVVFDSNPGLGAEKNLPGTDHRESSSFPGGSAIVRRVAKQIASLFPPGTSLKDHPDIPAIFRLLLKVPDELMQRLEYDESIVDVAVFVDVIASNVLRMPVLLQVAQELETHQPGWNLPISDERAAADLRRAVCYCFALHAIAFFLWMRAATWNAHEMVSCRRELKNQLSTTETYDWRLTEATTALCQLSSAISAKIAKNRRSPLLLEVDREQIATLFSKKRDQILEKYKMLLRSCTANDQKECCIRGHGWLDKIRSRVTESGDAAHEGRIRRDDNPPPPPPPPKGKDDVSIQIVHQSRHDATDDDALETAVRREQAAYVQATLLRVLASTAETTTQIDDAQVTSVARLGLTSQDALAVQTELWRDLSVEVDFNTLMDPNLSIAQLADKITRIARGEDETPLEEAAAPSRLVPLSNEKVLLLEATTKLPQWVCDMVQALSVVVVVVLVSLALVPSYRWGRWVQWRGNSIGTKRIDVRRDNSPWSHIKIAGTSKVFIYGLGIPLVIPTFMTSLSLWEMWCGDFLKDTVLINAFYRLRFARVVINGIVEKSAVVELGVEIEEGAILRQLSVASQFSRSTRFEMRAWFVDYFWHRIVVRLSGLLFQGNGLATNGLLRALGVDVDWSARFVSAEAVSASEADVITVEARAQISQCVVSCLTAASSYAPVRIGRDAEVGLDAYLEAGTVIGEDSVVGQQTLASGIVPPGSVKLGKITFRRRQSSRGTGNNSTKNGGGGGDLRLALVPFVSRTLLLALFGFVALIPSYELAVLVLFGSSNFYEDQDYLSGANEDGSRWTPPVDRNLGLLCIGPISLVAFACMSLVCRLWTYLVFGNFRRLDGTSRWVFEAFHEYQFMIIYASHKFAMPLLQGSRLAVAYMRFWGADVDWTAFINNQLFYEPPLLSLEAGCVVDQGVWHLGHVFISVSRYF
ncbi:hypothetical protein CTAYLR_008678 [Chrysophaeum taylorii]|uniref:AMP-dependent synthetase/ligase domain-containing protein n=1 Tax=Chrysophaeum taylorii TaxID=2483200 RepID=A0AAD7XNE5_9STRA|nr:hypothetical protein CTAYLR_008678 [Chrysophaeum taylorii]